MEQRQQEMERGSLYNQATGSPDASRFVIETPQLDYAGPHASDSTVTELPPAWEPKPSTWTVGYEAVGATSVGVEQERRSHSRRRGLRVKSTKLSDHNEGRHPSDGTQSKRLAELDKKRITQTLCSRLDIGGLEQEEAVRALLTLDLRTFGAHKKIERVALATICVIVDYQRRYKRRDHQAKRLGSDPTFKMLAHEFGLANNHIQLSRKVKEELKAVDFFEPGAPGLRQFERPMTSINTIGANVGKPLLLQNLSAKFSSTSDSGGC